MSDISCAADIYAAIRDHVSVPELDMIAKKAIEIFLNEGYTLSQIEDALGEFDEIYVTLDDYEDEEEMEVEMEDDEDMIEDDYSDEE